MREITLWAFVISASGAPPGTAASPGDTQSSSAHPLLLPGLGHGERRDDVVLPGRLHLMMCI